jgi:hypothetical protein
MFFANRPDFQVELIYGRPLTGPKVWPILGSRFHHILPATRRPPNFSRSIRPFVGQVIPFPGQFQDFFPNTLAAGADF